MAFFGKVGSSRHAKLRLNIWLSALSVSIGFRPARIRAMQRKFGLGPPPSMYALFKYTRSFGARFPSLVGKAFNGTFIRRSVAKIFANVKRKEEAFSGVWPSALGCSIVRLQPIHPSPVGKPICRFSNARKRATNARSLFANRVEAKFSKIDACPSNSGSSR